MTSVDEHVPVRMWGPLKAAEALRLGPLAQASWTDATSIEGVPAVSASAVPKIVLGW
jgi:hypothetical protein